MDWMNALSFMAVASLLVMSPGPNGVLIAKTVPTSGIAASFANVFGFVTAFCLHGTLSILGISAILLASAQAFFIVKMLGAAYLCWIGFKALRDAYRGNNAAQTVEPAKRQRTLRAAFFEGLLTNALNPKTSMFYLAAFPQFISVGEGVAASAFVLVMLHAFINVMWFGAMIILFARLTKFARSGNFQRWLSGVTGAVFVGFGVKLATYRPYLCDTLVNGDISDFIRPPVIIDFSTSSDINDFLEPPVIFDFSNVIKPPASVRNPC